jgi:hypothetical protein
VIIQAVMIGPILVTVFAAPEEASFLVVAWCLLPLLSLVWILRFRNLVGLARIGASNASLRNLLSLRDSGNVTPLVTRMISVVQAGLLRSDRPVEDRSPDRTIRTILGPRYAAPALLFGACGPLACAAFPWGFWLIWARDIKGHIYEDWLKLVLGSAFDWAFIAMVFTGGVMMLCMKRLAELFRAPGGEIAELALLPGLGDQQGLRAALIRQTLLRPLSWLGLGLWLGTGASIGAQLLLVGRFGGGLAAQLLLVLPMMAILCGGAVTALALLDGAFDRVPFWRLYGPLMIPNLLAFASFQVRAFTTNRLSATLGPPTWLWVIWVLVLLGLAVCLLALLARWNRRRYILCRS